MRTPKVPGGCTQLTPCCFVCRRLKSKSNTLHINLFIAFILRAALSFMKEVLFVQNLGLGKNVRPGTSGLLEFNEHETVRPAQ